VWSGREFRLQSPILAIHIVDGTRVAVTVPAGDLIKVVSGPKNYDDRMVDVLWRGEIVVMFAIDIQERGKEIIADWKDWAKPAT
jgi:hypothetical protein